MVSHSNMFAVLLVTTFSLQILAYAEGADWYVVNGAEDKTGCGTSLDNPCGNLGYVIRKAESDDTIHLAASDDLYPLCYTQEEGVESDGEVKKSLSIVGSVGRTRIGCQKAVKGQHVIRFTPGSGSAILKLKGLNVTNGAIQVGNGTLKFENVIFDKAKVSTLGRDCVDLSLSATNSMWSNEEMCDASGTCGVNNLKCGNIDVSLTNCHLKASPLIIRGSGKVKVEVQKSIFDGQDSTIHAISLTTRTDSEFHLINSSFVHFNYPSLTQYITNIHDAAVMVNSGRWTNGSLEFTAEGCNFEHNERALTLMGAFKRATVTNCLFQANEAMHSAAAILSLVDKETNVAISGSRFMGNMGGRIKRNFKIHESEEEVQIYETSVTVDTEEARGGIEPIGRGGAVRLQRGHMEIADSHFQGNTVNIQGGSIMSDMNTKLVLRNVQVFGPTKGMQPLVGDILYSRGSTELYNVHFVSAQGKTGMSVLEHVGGHWSLKVNRIRVDCPMGHGLRMQEVSAFGVTGNGLRSSTDLFDELSYNCDPCPLGFYSFDHGFVNNTMVPDTDSYVSLAVGSGEAQLPSYIGDYTYHGLQCLPCPDHSNNGHAGNESEKYDHGNTVHARSNAQEYMLKQCQKLSSVSTTINSHLSSMLLSVFIIVGLTLH